MDQLPDIVQYLIVICGPILAIGAALLASLLPTMCACRLDAATVLHTG